MVDGNHRRRTQSLGSNAVGDLRKRGAHRDLVAHRGAADHGDRQIQRSPAGLQLAGDTGQTLQPHEHDQRATPCPQPTVEFAPFLALRILMSGKNTQVLIHPAPRHRDTGRGRPGQGGADSRHPLEVEACSGQGPGFLRPAPENIGVSSLQPDDQAAGRRLLHEQAVDLFLTHAVVIRLLPRVKQLGRLRSEPEQFRIGQIVIDDNLRASEHFVSTQGEQARVTGTGSDQKTFSFFHKSNIAATAIPSSSASSRAPLSAAIFGSPPEWSNRTASRCNRPPSTRPSAPRAR